MANAPDYYVDKGLLKGSEADGLEKVPAGMFAIYSLKKVDGKHLVIGYTDSTTSRKGANKQLLDTQTGGLVVFFSNAPSDVVDYFSRLNQLKQTSTGQGGERLFQSVSAIRKQEAAEISGGTSATNPSGQQSSPANANGQNAPTGGASAPAATGTGTAGGYKGSTAGNGSSLLTGSLSDRYNGMDDSQQVIVAKADPSIAGSLAAMGGGNYSFAPTKSISALVNSVYSMTPAQRSALAKQLTGAGYKPHDLTLYGVASAFEGALQDLAQQNAADATRPQSLDEFLSDATAAQKAGAGATTKTHNTSSSTVDLTNPVEARGLVQNAIASALGRNPTAQEIAQFTSSLQAYEKANPKVTTGTTTTDQGDYTRTNSTTTASGGLSDPSAYAQQWVEQNFPGQVHAADIGSSLFGIIAKAANPAG